MGEGRGMALRCLAFFLRLSLPQAEVQHIQGAHLELPCPGSSVERGVRQNDIGLWGGKHWKSHLCGEFHSFWKVMVASGWVGEWEERTLSKIGDGTEPEKRKGGGLWREKKNKKKKKGRNILLAVDSPDCMAVFVRDSAYLSAQAMDHSKVGVVDFIDLSPKPKYSCTISPNDTHLDKRECSGNVAIRGDKVTIMDGGGKSPKHHLCGRKWRKKTKMSNKENKFPYHLPGTKN